MKAATKEIDTNQYFASTAIGCYPHLQKSQVPTVKPQFLLFLTISFECLLPPMTLFWRFPQLQACGGPSCQHAPPVPPLGQGEAADP